MGKSRRRKRLGYLCLGMLVMLISSACSEKEKISCGKEKLSPYLEEYQVAEEKLETCIYNKKPCLCVFMEEKKIRKHAAEELPQTVFLLEIETGKVLKQMRKEEWTEREDVVDKMEVQLKDLVDPKQLKYEKSAFFLTSDTLGIQVEISDIPEDSQIYDKFPELKKEKNKKKTIYFYIKENGKWEKKLEQFLTKGKKLQITEKEETIMKITPLV